MKLTLCYVLDTKIKQIDKYEIKTRKIKQIYCITVCVKVRRKTQNRDGSCYDSIIIRRNV